MSWHLQNEIRERCEYEENNDSFCKCHDNLPYLLERVERLERASRAVLKFWADHGESIKSAGGLVFVHGFYKPHEGPTLEDHLHQLQEVVFKP